MDYLDVTLNLSDGSYKPFYKPNSEINCIDKESNHPPSIITSLHLSVESPLLKLSFAEDVFTEEASLYQEALKRARRNHKLSYNNYFILTTIILLYIYNSINNSDKVNCNSNGINNDNDYHKN